MLWLREEREGVEHQDDLTLRARDLALVIGRCAYHVHRKTNWVEVRDYADPAREVREAVADTVLLTQRRLTCSRPRC